MLGCEGFCKEAVNTERGLRSTLKEFEGSGSYSCPVGFKHNPTTEAKTHALIKHGGRWTICTRNQWKYDKI